MVLLGVSRFGFRIEPFRRLSVRYFAYSMQLVEQL